MVVVAVAAIMVADMAKEEVRTTLVQVTHPRKAYVQPLEATCSIMGRRTLLIR